MLTIECREIGGVVVVDLSGHMEGGPSTKAVTETIRTRANEGHRLFVLNLAELAWMNSMGIGTLVESHATLKRRNGLVVLLSPCDRVRKVLTTTRLIPKIFTVLEEESEAVRYCVAHGDVGSFLEAQ